MGRTLTFTQVLSFEVIEQEQEAQDTLMRRCAGIKDHLVDLPGVQVVEIGTPRYYHFPVPQQDKPHQWRMSMFVKKQGRKTTWDDIQRTVNKSCAVAYKYL